MELFRGVIRLLGRGLQRPLDEYNGIHYTMLIRSFEGQAAKDIIHGDNTREARTVPRTLWKTAQRKLEHVDSATSLMDLAAVPGHRLEKLKGDLADCYSIRINDQYRIVFRWQGTEAFDVRIEDYH